jgi:hypothetical protein
VQKLLPLSADRLLQPLLGVHQKSIAGVSANRDLRGFAGCSSHLARRDIEPQPETTYRRHKLMNNGQSLLVAHCGAHKVTRDELREFPVPEGTKTHQPISHHEVVEVLEEALTFRYLKVVREEYAVSADGMKVFGIMELNSEFKGCRFAIGMRNSNDKSMRLALTVGYRVFVCDNMAFSGDFTPLSHKHTNNFQLQDAISIAVDRIHRSFAPLRKKVETMRDLELTEQQVKLLIYEAFMDRKVKGLPRQLMPMVHDHYFNPKQEAFFPRNLWSLSNAFTSAFKKLSPVKQFEVTARLGEFLTSVQDQIFLPQGNPTRAASENVGRIAHSGQPRPHLVIGESKIGFDVSVDGNGSLSHLGTSTVLSDGQDDEETLENYPNEDYPEAYEREDNDSDELHRIEEGLDEEYRQKIS